MQRYDVIVIGGGASGMMSAFRASEMGFRVLLIEKNDKLGVKLLMTGGGRCNFTNQADKRLFANLLGDNGKWFLSALSRFGSDDVIQWFKDRGIKSVTEGNGRVFPEGNRAILIVKALEKSLHKNNVDIIVDKKVQGFVLEDKRINELVMADGKRFSAFRYIIATGGKTYPLSGSTGDAYEWLRSMGHNIIDPSPGLAKIILKNNVKNLEGLSLENIKITIFQDKKKIISEIGDCIFTAHGLSGPLALSLSRVIAREGEGGISLKIDFLPQVNQDALSEKLQSFYDRSRRVSIKNILHKLFFRRLVDFILSQSDIDPSTQSATLSRAQKRSLIEVIKGFEFQFCELSGFADSMITVGGVDLKEVDPRTMKSRLVSNLYLAGEVLDLDGPTGGYNLQIAWTTGYVAGESATDNLQI